MRLLVIEDHPDILANITDYLTAAGHVVDCAHNGPGGLHLALTGSYDLIVLDIMLPGMDGYQLCRSLRASGKRTPIIMLTARDALDDRLHGLREGADDYLVKPFDMDELEARLRAMMRRAAGQASPVIRHADLEVDPAARIIRQAGQKVEVSPREFAVLWALLLARGRVLSRPQIEEHLYSWGDTVESNAVEVYVHHLRKKLGQKVIVTMRGVGYFMPQEQE